MVDFQALRQAMVVGQILPCVQVSGALRRALETLPREDCVAAHWRTMAYADGDAPLEDGRFLLSALSFMRLLKEAQIEKYHKVLDVGAGVGYTSAMIGAVAERVVGLETSPTLVLRAQEFLSKNHMTHVSVEAVSDFSVVPEEAASYGVILVEGCLNEAPHGYLEALKEGGRLLCFLRRPHGSLPQATLFEKYQGTVSKKALFEGAASLLESQSLSQRKAS
ncbi:MAG: methyltransferase domain-containing protein [Alphaproteobacteria bacterium]|nr:methyltransferase domain-containing protein [Alphaproteobacteria bacterium]